MSQKILIIDDEKWYFDPILDILDFEKITYDFCKNGDLGIKKLTQQNYNVVILDMKVSLGESLEHLRGKDVPGILIFDEIRKIKPRIPVICFTVLSDEEIRRKVEHRQGKYFAKGGNMDDLIAEIKKYNN